MLEPQETIADRYCLQRRLRRGGMSQVYLALDTHTQHEVAIKLVASDDPDCILRLQREVQTTRKLRHDHILLTLGDGEDNGWHYLVMPYMRRGTLRERLAKGPLTLEEAGKILAQVADALQFAHERGIVHRDVKPSNILLDNDDEQVVYLADFGLAKAIGAGSDITQTGCLIGTPEYMAPELVDQPESPSSDIYALGVLLYQMLTGQLPFKGATPLSIYWKHLYEQPSPPSHLNAMIAPPVEQVMLRALAKDPRQRFKSAREMALAYTQALAIAASPESAAIATNAFAPVQIVLKKASEITLPPAARAVPWWQQPRRRIQMGIVAAMAVLMLLVAPLSLGFLLSRDGTGTPTIVGSSTNLVDKPLQGQPAHTATPVPTPQHASTTHSSPGNTSFNLSQPRPPHHNHKHEHGHGHGNGDGNQNDE